VVSKDFWWDQESGGAGGGAAGDGGGSDLVGLPFVVYVCVFAF
jgi:hypothetical protein